MKKIFTLLLSAIATLTAFADSRPGGEINITRLDRKKYTVEVDGRQFSAINQTVTVSDITPGYHTVKIYAIKKGNPFFGVLGGLSRKDLIYNNSLSVKPWRQLNITINRSVVSVEEKRIRRNRDGGYNGDDRWNDRDGDYGDYDRNDHDVRVYRPINESSFFNLTTSLRRENFENNRLALAQQSVSQNYFTVDQVRQLMQLFAFENNKLELAKFSFDQTVDKNNYTLLCDELSFNRSKQELKEYIHGR